MGDHGRSRGDHGRSRGDHGEIALDLLDDEARDDAVPVALQHAGEEGARWKAVEGRGQTQCLGTHFLPSEPGKGESILCNSANLATLAKQIQNATFYLSLGRV